MKSSMILMTSWLAADPRRTKLLLTASAVMLMLLGLGSGHEQALAGKATGGVH
ncbi:MAG: hypothetical protein K8J31_18805 [Anaerolineae bacterium]|nr:hypothetical protein [Anaerolineae bacterium]